MPRVREGPERLVEAHADHARPVPAKGQDFQGGGAREQPGAEGRQGQGQCQGNVKYLCLGNVNLITC